MTRHANPIIPLKRMAAVMPSNVDKHSVEGERPVRLCNYVDVYKNERITDSLDFMEATATEAQIARFTLQAHDVIVTKDSEEPTDIGIPAYVPKSLPGVVCGYHLAVLRPSKDQLFGGYLHWALQSSEVQAYYSTAATGISRYALGISDLGMTPIHVPTRSEQERIANFLDEQTARIDALIAEKERLSTVLWESLSSAVELAVAAPENGLQLVAPLKRVVISVVTGPFGSALHSSDYVDDGTPVINPAHIQNGRLVPDPQVAIAGEKLEELKSYQMTSGQLIVGRRGEMGRCAVVEREAEGWLCGTGCLLATPDRKKVIPKYLQLVVSSRRAKDWLQLESVGSTMDNLNTDILGRLPGYFPSLEEQQRRCEQADRAYSTHSNLLEHVRQHLSRLREYRASLISAAVTGQLDLSTFEAAA